MMASAMLNVALANARESFRVLPCRPNGKVPVLRDWPNKATSNLSDVADLWAEHGEDCNVGIACGDGFIVVDVDCKGGKRGFASLAALPQLPATRTVRTPSDGAHLYLKIPPGLRIQNSAGTLADGVDIRAMGGQVLAPGSVVDGKPYVLARDLPIADAPDWLIAKLTEYRVMTSAPAGAMLGTTDAAEAIERAKTYVASALPAIEGEGGDSHTYKVCARLRRDFNLSIETALEVLEPWNDRCVPPWDIDKLTEKLENAGQYGQNLAGTDSPLVGFAPIEAPPFNTSKFLASISTYRSTREDDAAAPRLPWLVPGRLMRRNLTVLFAPGATGKSLLMLEWAVAAALGPSALGASDFCGLNARERCNVLVINAEDETSVMEQRLGAICDAFKIPRNEVWGRIRLQSGKDRGSFRFKVAAKNAKSGAIEPTPEVDEIIAYCKAHGIDVVIVDPLIRTHPANENDNGEMQQVADIFEHIAAETNAAVVLPHHTKKPGRGGYSEFAGSPDAGRGASAIKDASRVALTLFPMSEADGAELNVPVHIRHRYVRLDDAKMNFGLAGPEAQWFMKRTVQTANGDQTGVLVPVKIGARAEVEPTAEQLEQVYEYLCGVTVSNEWQRLSADPQAPLYLPRQTGILRGAEDDSVPGIIEAALCRLKTSERAELVSYGRPNKAGKIPERWRAIIT